MAIPTMTSSLILAPKVMNAANEYLPQLDPQLGPQLVSILARPEGRALRGQNLARPAHTGHVSILARPEGRALRPARRGMWRDFRFQSSPVPKDGRYPRQRRRHPGALRFQSSPVPKDGRYAQAPMTRSFVAVVSILARPEGRALRDSLSNGDPFPGFQSSPVPKDGRYLTRVGFVFVQGMFQSSPVPKDGRYRWPIAGRIVT